MVPADPMRIEQYAAAQDRQNIFAIACGVSG
jgi:hypothetical protein